MNIILDLRNIKGAANTAISEAAQTKLFALGINWWDTGAGIWHCAQGFESGISIGNGALVHLFPREIEQRKANGALVFDGATEFDEFLSSVKNAQEIQCVIDGVKVTIDADGVISCNFDRLRKTVEDKAAEQFASYIAARRLTT